MRVGGRDEAVDDLGVDVVEAVGRLVDVVERGSVGDEVGARVAAGAQEADGDAVDGGERLRGDEPVAARPEPDDGDLHATPIRLAGLPS